MLKSVKSLAATIHEARNEIEKLGRARTGLQVAVGEVLRYEDPAHNAKAFEDAAMAPKQLDNEFQTVEATGKKGNDPPGTSIAIDQKSDYSPPTPANLSKVGTELKATDSTANANTTQQ